MKLAGVVQRYVAGRNVGLTMRATTVSLLLLILLISYIGLGYLYLHYPTIEVRESRVYLYESAPPKP